MSIHIPVKPPKWVIERIRECLSYDDVHGGLVWAKVKTNRVKVGDRAGNLSCGYEQIGFRKQGFHDRKVQVHHIVWFLHTGEWPTSPIDHKDMNRQNNRFDNLRLATTSQNGMNKPQQSNNQLGIKNICFDTQKQKYKVDIKSGGKRFSRRYKSLEDAIEARDTILSIYHGDYARY
jgi:hypothetical protein